MGSGLPPSGLNFQTVSTSKARFGVFRPDFVLRTFKTQNDARGAYRTRPSQPFISRTAKSPKSDRLPTACAGTAAVPPSRRVFLLPPRYGAADVRIRGVTPRIP